MSVISTSSKAILVLAAMAMPVAGGVSAQQVSAPPDGILTTVYGEAPADLSGLSAGPEIAGFISARTGDRLTITDEYGVKTAIMLSDATKIRSTGGFLGLDRDTLAEDSLITGLPVSVETVAWGRGLVASKVDLKNKDRKFAAMIHNGTDQRFVEQAEATDALRGRMADIDKYNIKDTTNVTFAVGQSMLSAAAKADLCAAAAEAEAIDNALLLVVGYTDSTGSQEVNQRLSEKRASSVVNHLQQQCGWAPYRMLTPAGMAEADPLGSNDSEYGKAQNRRVAVNVLVSKSVDGL